MPYIDSEYYTLVYKGIMPQNPDDLDKLILRASDVIDMITSYKLQGVDIDSPNYNTFIRDQIKKATAAQVEYFVVNGGYESSFNGNDSVDSASIGSFSYSGGGKDSSKNVESQMTSHAVLQYLTPTGLLYSGIKTHDYGKIYYEH